MRSGLAFGASALAALAGVLANQDGDTVIAPSFIGLTFAAGLLAWAVHPPFEDRRLARGIALAWLAAAIWIAVLLLMYRAMGGDGPPPAPEARYLGLTATVYHLLGVYGGLVFALLAAFAPDAWLAKRRRV